MISEGTSDISAHVLYSPFDTNTDWQPVIKFLMDSSTLRFPQFGGIAAADGQFHRGDDAERLLLFTKEGSPQDSHGPRRSGHPYRLTLLGEALVAKVLNMR